MCLILEAVFEDWPDSVRLTFFGRGNIDVLQLPFPAEVWDRLCEIEDLEKSSLDDSEKDCAIADQLSALALQCDYTALLDRERFRQVQLRIAAFSADYQRAANQSQLADDYLCWKWQSDDDQKLRLGLRNWGIEKSVEWVKERKRQLGLDQALADGSNC